MLPIAAEGGGGASAPAPIEASFTFGPPSAAPPHPCFSHKDRCERWTKWGHAPRLLTLRLPLTRGGRVGPSDESAFLQDLFNSPTLRAHLAPLSPAGQPTPLLGAVTGVRFQRLAVNATSLSLFDALIPSVLGVAEAAQGSGGGGGGGAGVGAAPPTVWIRRRLEEPWEGVTIGDHLREALVLPPEGDPEGVDPGGSAECLQQPNRFSALFTPAQRSEWLWRAARWVAAGGPMSQHEDEWTPYAAAIRDMARDFLTVVKATTSDAGAAPSPASASAVTVATSVWEVQALAGLEAGELKGAGGLFPCDSPHNVCWVFSDPIHRCVHVLHSSFVTYW